MSTGRPAFGSQEIGIGECPARWRRCSLISPGPVAQFSPIMSMPSGSRAVSAAAISVPSSIAPVVSMVTWAMTIASGSQLGHGPLAPDDGRLGLEQVLAGLDDQRVRAAPQQPLRVELVGVAQLAERGVAEGGQLGAGADRAEHPARAAGRGPAVSGGPGQPGGRLGQFLDPADQSVLAEVAQVRAEGVRGDAVRARLEVGVVDRRSRRRAGSRSGSRCSLRDRRNRRGWRRWPGAWCPSPRPPPRPARPGLLVESS